MSGAKKPAKERPASRSAHILIPMDQKLKDDFTARAAARNWSVTAVVRSLMKLWAGQPPDIPGEDILDPEDVEFEMMQSGKRPHTRPGKRKKTARDESKD